MAQNLRQWADATAVFCLEGKKAAATNAPMFAHAAEALAGDARQIVDYLARRQDSFLVAIV